MATGLVVLLALSELLALAAITLASRFYYPQDAWTALAERAEPGRSLSFGLLTMAVVLPLVALSRGKGRRLMLRVGARLCGAEGEAARRLASFAAATLLATCALLYYAGSHLLMAAVGAGHPPLMVAGYAEPWRTLAFLVALVLVVVPLVRLGTSPTRLSLRRAGVALCAVPAGLALAFELSTCVVYGPVTGELYVASIAYERSSMAVPMTQDGACVRARFGSRYRWTVNGKVFYVSFLPLPRGAGAIETALARPLPGECGKSPAGSKP